MWQSTSGADTIDGTRAVVYALHTDADGRSSDAQVWVAKSTGLERREDVDLDTGDGSGKTHVTTRFEHTNVHAPSS